MNTQRRPWVAEPWMAPVLGTAIGAAGGGLYWLGAQIWPASIAVVVSMLAMELLDVRSRASSSSTPASSSPTSEASVAFVFRVLVKYNALMALSAARLPFVVPENLALGVIMIAGQACSRALALSASKPEPGDFGIALVIGFAPAMLIGMPGLIGLAAAMVGRIALIAHARRTRAAARDLDRIQELTEVCFYLGVVAARAYI